MFACLPTLRELLEGRGWVGLALPSIPSTQHSAWDREVSLFTCELSISTDLPLNQHSLSSTPPCTLSAHPALQHLILALPSSHVPLTASLYRSSMCARSATRPLSTPSPGHNPNTSSNNGYCLQSAFYVTGPVLGSFHSLAHLIPSRS